MGERGHSSGGYQRTRDKLCVSDSACSFISFHVWRRSRQRVGTPIDVARAAFMSFLELIDPNLKFQVLLVLKRHENGHVG